MKLGNFTGIRGIPNQDIAMWESMGPIADRTSERLGASDIAIVQFRRLMIAAARSHAEGGAPIGLMEPHRRMTDQHQKKKKKKKLLAAAGSTRGRRAWRWSAGCCAAWPATGAACGGGRPGRPCATRRSGRGGGGHEVLLRFAVSRTA